MLNYLISFSNNQDMWDGTIHNRTSKLKVNAFDLLNPGFTPKNGEIRYFVTCGHQKFVFETAGYKYHRKLIILQMISWYCIYLGLMEAQIHSALPIAS